MSSLKSVKPKLKAPAVNKPTLLLLEDEPWLGDLYSKSLKKRGYKIIATNDAQHALDILDKHPEIQLCLIDLLLPRFSGLSFLYEAVSHIDWQSKQFIVMSSLPSDDILDDPALWQHLNVVAYLYKPSLDPLTLADEVEAALKV